MLSGSTMKGLIYKWLCAVEAIKFPIKSQKGLNVVYSEDVQEVSWYDVSGSLKMRSPNQFIIPVNEEACVADHSMQEEDEELQNPNFLRDFHDWEGIKKRGL